jgi:putative spermidine/putrescine transport system substrate-binding protein
MQSPVHNTIDGVHYGISHGWGANLLMWNTSKITTAPTSWSAVFETNPLPAYAGKVTAYNYAIYIADAALYLMATKPDLKITNPYALDATQLAAAKDLLLQQKTLIGKYWGTSTDEISGFENGDMAIGTAWQYQANVINADGKKTVKFTKPKEGATGWSDTWMLYSKAAHPNCMYEWMNYIISPKANADVTVYFGEAPVSAPACAEAEKQQAHFCDDFHAADETYFKDVYYWNTPTTTCLDGRTDVQCTDFDAWTKTWNEVTGG